MSHTLPLLELSISRQPLFSVLVSWRLWDEVRFETLMDWILILVRCLVTWIFLECGSPSLPAIRFW